VQRNRAYKYYRDRRKVNDEHERLFFSATVSQLSIGAPRLQGTALQALWINVGGIYGGRPVPSGATDRGSDIVGDGLLEGVEASTEPLGDSYDGCRP
jgi:hypothetical protein